METNLNNCTSVCILPFYNYCFVEGTKDFEPERSTFYITRQGFERKLLFYDYLNGEKKIIFERKITSQENIALSNALFGKNDLPHLESTLKNGERKEEVSEYLFSLAGKDQYLLHIVPTNTFCLLLNSDHKIEVWYKYASKSKTNSNDIDYKLISLPFVLQEEHIKFISNNILLFSQNQLKEKEILFRLRKLFDPVKFNKCKICRKYCLI